MVHLFTHLKNLKSFQKMSLKDELDMIWSLEMLTSISMLFLARFLADVTLIIPHWIFNILHLCSSIFAHPSSTNQRAVHLELNLNFSGG